MRREMPVGLLSSPYSKLQRTAVKNKLRRLVRLIGSRSFTARQMSVLRLVFRGFTETEIAEQLDVHQTTIHKILFGNLIYHGEYFGRRHGGILTKIRKICNGSRRDLLQEWLEFEMLSNLNWGKMLDSF